MSEELKPGQEKFDLCKFRSTNEEEIGDYGCCGNNTLHFGYICFRRNIEDLVPLYCAECELYKEKRNI